MSHDGFRNGFIFVGPAHNHFDDGSDHEFRRFRIRDIDDTSSDFDDTTD